MEYKKHFFILLNISLVLIIILLISKLNFILLPVSSILDTLLTPVIISIFLYYALRPVVRKFEKIKISKGLVVLLTMLFFIFIITIIFVYGGSSIINQFQNSFAYNLNAIANYKNVLHSNLAQTIYNFELTQKIIESLKNNMLKITSSLFGVFSQVGSVGAKIILVPFIVFYFLKEDISFVRSFIRIIPCKYRASFKNMFKEIDEIFSIYISGQLLVALILGVLMYIGYLIIGMPNALLMGFFATITSIIPFLGAILGVIPALLIALTIDPSMILKVIIVAIIVQQLEGNLITPNIVGNKLNVHPLAVMFIVIISVTLFGIIGAFVGVPLFITITIIVKNIYKLNETKKVENK